MLKIKFNPVNIIFKQFSMSIPKTIKTVVFGASGGVGKPLCMLLKRSPLITKLNMYDIVNVLGLAKDLSHINTPCAVQGFDGLNYLKEALCDMDVVIMVAGAARNTKLTREDLFSRNAEIVTLLAEACAKYCPKAWIVIVTDPVNSMVPLVSEIFKSEGVYDPKKIFGFTSLDVIRARVFIGWLVEIKPELVNVDVVGGHSGVTIVPILSRAIPHLNIPEGDLINLTERIQEAGTKVVKVKKDTGSATLSAAHGIAQFITSISLAVQGKDDITEYAYIASCVTEAEYFATKVLLGKEGVQGIYKLGKLSRLEEKAVKMAVEILKGHIETGKKFARESRAKCK